MAGNEVRPQRVATEDVHGVARERVRVELTRLRQRAFLELLRRPDDPSVMRRLAHEQLILSHAQMKSRLTHHRPGPDVVAVAVSEEYPLHIGWTRTQSVESPLQSPL